MKFQKAIKMYRTPNLYDKKKFEIQNGGIYICDSEKTGWVIKQ